MQTAEQHLKEVPTLTSQPLQPKVERIHFFFYRQSHLNLIKEDTKCSTPSEMNQNIPFTTLARPTWLRPSALYLQG